MRTRVQDPSLERRRPRIEKLALEELEPGTEVIYIQPSTQWGTDRHVEVVVTASRLGKVICGGRRHSDHEPCLQPPVPGKDNGRCRWHGGESPSGALSATHKGRGYSLDIPQRLALRFEEALEDPELTSLGSELALVDTRLGDLLQQLENAGSPEIWESTKEIMQEALTAANRDDPVEAAVLLEQGLIYIRQLTGETETWSQVLKAVEQRRKLASEERKREDQLEATMTAKQAMTFVAALKIAIREEVTDEGLRLKIGDRLAQLLGSHTS